MTPEPAPHDDDAATPRRRGRLRLVPRDRRPRLAVEGALSPELLAILHFTILTALRPAAAPMAISDDLRLAVDELVGTRQRGGTVAAEVVVDGRTVSLAVTVPWEVPDTLGELVAPLVDDLTTRRGSHGTVVEMERSW